MKTNILALTLIILIASVAYGYKPAKVKWHPVDDPMAGISYADHTPLSLQATLNAVIQRLGGTEHAMPPEYSDPRIEIPALTEYNRDEVISTLRQAAICAGVAKAPEDEVIRCN